MSRERKLRLVEADEQDAADGPALDELECAPETERCRELVGATTARLPLDALDHEVLLALTVGEQSARFDDEDRQRAVRLGDVLDATLDGGRPLGRRAEEGDLPTELASMVELSVALRAASNPRQLDDLTHERLLQRAMRRPLRAHAVPRRGAMWATLAAVAAGVALFWSTLTWVEETRAPVARPVDVAPSPPQAASLVRKRSTQTLFDPATPFPTKGGESARVDRIARARAAELRANRFAMWGVQ